MDRAALEHLCALSRLQLSADELIEFERKFARLLEFVEITQYYEPKSEGPPLTLLPQVDLRRDHSSPFEWPDSAAHDYRVPQIIDFEGDS
jgi:Asp-tRNA(Asn)/Glu-tRNA(Gln) amidotransferase C subunit